MREKTDHWEYISTYVDDLAISSKDPQAIVDKLVKGYKFKIKGTGPISYHLGCDFMCNDNKVLCIQPKSILSGWSRHTSGCLGRNQRNYGLSPLGVLILLLPSCPYPASVLHLALDISNIANIFMHIVTRCKMLRYEFELKSQTSPHFWTSLLTGRNQYMAMSRKSSQKTVRGHSESMLNFCTTLT